MKPATPTRPKYGPHYSYHMGRRKRKGQQHRWNRCTSKNSTSTSSMIEHHGLCSVCIHTTTYERTPGLISFVRESLFVVIVEVGGGDYRASSWICSSACTCTTQHRCVKSPSKGIRCQHMMIMATPMRRKRNRTARGPATRHEMRPTMRSKRFHRRRCCERRMQLSAIQS